MPGESKYDLDFRPKTYWVSEDLYTHLMSTIKGEERRKDVQKVLESGRINELQEWLTSSAITDEERSIIEGVHPRIMGGEYLPDLNTDEVEIARIVMQSTLQDVISFRAQLIDKSIHYSIVADYDPEAIFDCKPQQSTEPLTMGEMISMIDRMGFIDEGRNWHVKEDVNPEEMVDFFSVFSAFYPELSAYFEEEALQWCKGVLEEKARHWVEIVFQNKTIYTAEEIIDYCNAHEMDLNVVYEKLSELSDPLSKVFLCELCERYPYEFSSRGSIFKAHKPLNGQLELPFKK